MQKGLFQCLKSRDLIDAVTSDSLELLLDKPTHAYLGIDPTADSLHLGHLEGLRIAKWFLDYGHQITILIGGATARVGDPSGKNLERPLLELSQVSDYAAKLTTQVKDILGAHDRVHFVDNYNWFHQIDLLSFLRDTGKHFRLGVMLSKDTVKNRLYSEEGISFTEFTYQILQAYDFLHLFKTFGVSIQLGGSDQWGNITAGTDLVRKVLKQEVFGLTFPLLTRSDGKKFGKSESGAIWLLADKCSPYDLYQYLYRVQDGDVVNLLKKLTSMSLDDIEALEQVAEPNFKQKKLASEVVKWLHGEESLAEALALTETLKPGHDAELKCDDLAKMHVLEGGPSLAKHNLLNKKYTDLFFELGLVSSKSEALRVLKNGGAYLNNQKIQDHSKTFSERDLIGESFLLLALGKKKKIIIHVC